MLVGGVERLKMNLARNLKQTAVYWATPTPDGYGGFTFDDPVEISCRWEQTHKLFIDPLGEERLSESEVFVGQDVGLGGYLYLGGLDDLDSTIISPQDVSGSKKIQQFDKLPDLRAVGYLRRAWL